MLGRGLNMNALVSFLLVGACLFGLFTQQELSSLLAQIPPTKMKDAPNPATAKIHVITATSTRNLQFMYLSRLGQSLTVAEDVGIHWILVDDSLGPSEDVDSLLRELNLKGISITYLPPEENEQSINKKGNSSLVIAGKHSIARAFSRGVEALRLAAPLPSSYALFSDDTNMYFGALFNILAAEKGESLVPVWPTFFLKRNVVEYPLVKDSKIVDFIESKNVYGSEKEQYLRKYPSTFSSFAIRSWNLLHPRKTPLFDRESNVPFFMEAVGINSSLDLKPLPSSDILAWSLREI